MRRQCDVSVVMAAFRNIEHVSSRFCGSPEPTFAGHGINPIPFHYGYLYPIRPAPDCRTVLTVRLVRKEP